MFVRFYLALAVALALAGTIQQASAQGTLGGAFAISGTQATVGYAPVRIGFSGCELFPNVRLELWALNKPWFPAYNSTGQIVASQELGGKGCGWVVGNGGSITMPLTAPPPGTYSMMVVLSMRPMAGCPAADGWCIYDFTDAGTYTFSAVVAPQVLNAIEFYHAGFNHYFVTTNATEINYLDTGYFVGWTRTGQSFQVYAGSAGHVPVCRFFSVSFAPKSSHFYTPNSTECAIVKGNANWQFEDVVFYATPTDNSGMCLGGTVPLYRLYNNGQGGAPNHRYTRSNTVRQQMLSQGWIPEGATNFGVIMCVPL